jgi:HK97 family phage major capsid protein
MYQAHTQSLDAVKKLGDRMDALDLLLQQKREGKAAATLKYATELMEEYLGSDGYLRKGNVGPNMKKALVEGNDTLGGFTAPPEYVKEIIKGEVEYSPIRALARQTTISGSIAEVPKKTATSTANWLGSEAGTDIPEVTGLGYGLESIPAHYLVYALPLSKQLVNDSAFNLDAEIKEDYSLAFGVKEGAGFVSGTGKGQPEGLLTKSGVTEVVTGNASDITADGLLDLCYALKDGYARNGTWLMKRATVGKVRKIKDGDGNYLWQTGLQAGQPNTIEGHPVVECPDMPAAAAGTYPIVFGDIKRAYRIVDNMNTMFLRDDLTLARKMQILYVGAKAVGGQVVDTDAIVKQKVAQS